MKYDIVEYNIKIGNKIIYGIDKDILCIIHSLEKEIQELKKQLEEVEEENFNLRENIYIEKMSFPSNGRNIKELIEMPSYEKLQQENQSLKKQIEEYDRKLFFTKNELDMRQKSIDNKLNQQKEFIEWLENEILELKKISTSTLEERLGKDYLIIQKEEILSKYKEIIGVSNEH